MVRGRWKATTDHISQGVPDEVSVEGSRDFTTDRWALFDLEADFSEARDLADEHPEVVAELEALWWSDAGRFNVLAARRHAHRPSDGDGAVAPSAAVPLVVPPEWTTGR